MKMIQTLLEEKASTQKIIKAMAGFLSDLSNKVDDLNNNIKNLKESVDKQNEKPIQGPQIVVEKYILDSTPQGDQPMGTSFNINNTKSEDPDFIPSIGASNLKIQTKKTSTKKTKKDFAGKAKLLKENDEM